MGRIYDSPMPPGAHVVLVDRLWPRGVAKAAATWDEWVKEVAPSDGLRRRYHADRDFDAFAADYRAELGHEPARRAVAYLAGIPDLVLVTSAKDLQHCHVPVLCSVLEDR